MFKNKLQKLIFNGILFVTGLASSEVLAELNSDKATLEKQPRECRCWSIKLTEKPVGRINGMDARLSAIAGNISTPASCKRYCKSNNKKSFTFYPAHNFDRFTITDSKDDYAWGATDPDSDIMGSSLAPPP